MFISKKHLSRRTVLKGAGVALGLPLLDAMVPAATALADTAAQPVQRAGWVYFPHGAIMDNTAHGAAWDRWTPVGVGQDFAFSPILASLEPFRDHVTVISSLDNRGTDTGQIHATRVGTWLTCVLPPPTFEPNNGPSVDQVAARFFARDTLVPSMQLAAVTPNGGSAGPYGSSYSANLSWASATEFLRPQSNLTVAFQNTFGPGAAEAMRASLNGQPTSLLDLTGGAIAALLPMLGPADRAVMENYLAAVRDLETRVLLLEQKRAQLAAMGITAPPADPADYAAKFDAMFDLVVLAWQTDTSRYFTYLTENEGAGGSPFGVTFPTGGWHSSSSHADQANYLAALVEVQTRFTERFSRFIAKLANTPDGDGSLLDHSMTVWGSAMSNSHRHTSYPLPTVLLGRGAGAIRGGQHLRYPEPVPLANLWLTMLQRLGVPAESFGNSTGALAEV